MKRLSLVGVLLWVLVGVSPAAGAQDATPIAPVERDAISIAAGLPDAGAIGPDWSLVSSAEVEPISRTDSPRYVARYVDRDGNRVVVTIVVYGQSALDAGVAYDAAQDYVADTDRQFVDSDDALNNAQLRRIATPDGCSDVVRAVGVDPLTLFPVGLTLCVDEEGRRIVTVVASGDVPGEGDPLRYQGASDRVMAVVLPVRPAS